MPPAAKPPGSTNWIGAGCVGLLLLGGPILAGLRGLMHRVPAYRGWQESLTSLIQSDDLAGLAWYVRLGREVNEVDPATGSHVVFYTGDPATIGFLIDAGIDPNARDFEGDTLLQESVRANQLDNVIKLLAHGADPDARSRTYGTTALADAIHQQRDDAAAILRATGAHDVTVTAANGSPLPADGGAPLALVRRYHAALLASDREAIARLSPGASTLDPANEENWVDLPTWQQTRPFRTRLVSGFANAQAATLVVCGETTEGWVAVWGFQLSRHQAERPESGVVRAAPAEAPDGASPPEDASGGIWVIDDNWWLVDRPPACPSA